MPVAPEDEAIQNEEKDARVPKESEGEKKEEEKPEHARDGIVWSLEEDWAWFAASGFLL